MRRGGQLQQSSNAPKKRRMAQVVSLTGRSFAAVSAVSGTRRKVVVEEEKRLKHVLTSPSEQAALQGEELPNVPHGFTDPDNDVLFGHDGTMGVQDSDWETEVEEESHIVRLAKVKKYYRMTSSYRTRQERAALYHKTWKDLMPAMDEVYLDWKRRTALGLPLDTAGSTSNMPTFQIQVINIFEPPRDQLFVRAHENEDGVLTMLRYGFLACTPLQPALAISIRTLELYRQLRAHHARLGFQPFARALSAIAQVPYRPELRRQLTSAFDAYLMLRRDVEKSVNVYLGRDSPDWRLLHSCPPCNYKLSAEPELLVERLWAMDGNGSLKRHAAAGSADTRRFDSDYFLETADNFKDEVKKQGRHPKSRKHVMGAQPGDTDDTAADPLPCQDNWKNMQPEHMKVALDFFEQTGIFIGVCRHGLVLKVQEMIRSGELAKYGIAQSAHMMDTAPGRQIAGYDIGCGFSTTLSRSSLAERAQSTGFKTIVNAFHGHAHNRLCQLQFHPIYTDGVGLEDLETCERVFSESNDVARTIRFGSHYHYQQFIDLHFQHWDEVKYTELSRFLQSNYAQALKIVAEGEAVLRTAAAVGYQAADFERWREEELKYLASLKQEPTGNILAIGYVEALMKLADKKAKYDALDAGFANLTPATFAAGEHAAYERQLARRERARRDALHDLELAEKDVRAYESKVEPAQRWTPMHREWIDALVYIRERKLRLALDHLERLVVQRLFELTKANMSDVCYKLRQQIAKALQTRSKAIRNALAKYNEAAKELNPAVEELLWETVVEWTELADFSLLRMSRHDIADRPWANITNREFMTKYFKLKRAREEILRCNVEARRLRTWIDDEDRQLFDAVESAERSGSPLAVELQELYHRRSQINHLHRVRLQKLELSKGFTGTPGPGTRINQPGPAQPPRGHRMGPRERGSDQDNDDGDDEGTDDETLLDAAEQFENFETSFFRDVDE